MEDKKQKLWTSFGFAAFVYFFLLLFQPFEIDKIKMSIPIYLLGFFFITLVVMLITNFLIPFLFPNYFDVEKWDVKKSIIFNTTIITIIGFLNWLYNHSIEKSLTIDHSLGYFLIITFGVGVFPSVFFTLIMEKYLSHKHQQVAVSLEETIRRPIAQNETSFVTIQSDSEKETFQTTVDQIICAKAEGNYIRLYYYSEEKHLKDRFVRNTLSKLEDDFEKFHQIKRCHRSYLVNFNQVEHVSGNARNYNLHFNDLDFTIPISRSFPKEIIREFKGHLDSSR